MSEKIYYKGLDRGYLVEIGLPLLVFGPFLVLSWQAYQSAKLTGAFLTYYGIPFLYVVPWIVGLRIKNGIESAHAKKIFSSEAAELFGAWLRSIQWSTYVVMAIITLMSKLAIIR